MKLTIDFETRSPVDIKKCGAWKYGMSSHTTPLCLAVKQDNEPTRLVTFGINDFHNLSRLTFATMCELIQAADTIEAHNAEFERIIWNCIMVPRFNVPRIPLKKWRCSAAKAASFALPRTLAGAGAALGLPVQKDTRGGMLVRRYCTPKGVDGNGNYLYNDDLEGLTDLFAYCIQDVDSEHAISQYLPDLIPQEEVIWRLNTLMNSRGFLIDIPSVKSILAMLAVTERNLLAEVADLTEGDITSVRQVSKVSEFCGIDNLTAAAVATALDGEKLNPVARRLLEIRQVLGLSSTSKFNAMLNQVSYGDRLRGCFMYHGASTGRVAGRLVQPQNFPRSTVKPNQVDGSLILVREQAFDWIADLDKDPMTLAKKLLRPMITAEPGNDLIAADYASIEARVVLWLAKETAILDILRSGGDIYCEFAEDIYGYSINKEDNPEERQVGKAGILGCGFGMGSVRFFAECVRNGIKSITHKLARVVIKKYRVRFPGVPALWYGLENAAIDAIHDGEGEYAGIKWRMWRQFLKCRLPSGRELSYAEPQLEAVPAWIYPTLDEDNEKGKIMIVMRSRKLADSAARKRAKDDAVTITGEPIEKEKLVLSHMAVNAKTKQWTREKTYGGKLTENVVQATARDIMAAGIVNVEKAGYPVVMTVHDEIVSEIPETFGSLPEYIRLMTDVPEWAAGCPVAAEGWRGKRYRKG